MRKANYMTGMFLIMLSFFFIFASKRLPSVVPGAGLGPGIVPFWMAVCMGSLSVMLIINNAKTPEISNQPLFNRKELLGVIVIFVSMLIYVLSMNYLGFFIGTLVFVAFLSHLLGQYSWWKCIIFGTAVSGLCIQIFRSFLAMPLPQGFFGI